MVKACLVAFQTGHNLPQARRSAELAVQQGDQVPLRRQFTRQLVGPTLCKANERCNDQKVRRKRQSLTHLRSVFVNVSRREEFPRAGSGERASGR